MGEVSVVLDHVTSVEVREMPNRLFTTTVRSIGGATQVVVDRQGEGRARRTADLIVAALDALPAPAMHHWAPA